VLFISYNALIEPLGPTQILPYISGLADTCEMAVLSFEKRVRSADEDARDTAALDKILSARGIRWIRLRYHKRPSLPATLFDIARGVMRIVGEHRRQPFDLLHARGYVPGAIAWVVKKRTGVPFLFDIRGLQAEEYADAGHWDVRGFKFRLTKRVEQAILHDADGIVTLTNAIRPVLREFDGLKRRATAPPWSVIPTCVDLDHFSFDAAGRQRVRAHLNVGDRPVLVYAGSIGTWYLLDEMLDFYQAARARWPGLFLLALVNRSPETVAGALAARGIAADDYRVTWARHEEMPAYLSAADAGIAFIRPCVSKRSSSPTKYAEYLACGLPMVANAGVGDVDDLLARTGAGAILSEHSPQAYQAAADRIRDLALPANRARWRAVAETEFSVAARACPAYRQLYAAILRRPRYRGLFLTPYPFGCAPSQRLKFEQYYASFEEHDIRVVVSPFVTPALWRVLYRRGFWVRKAVLGAWGHLRRLRDLRRARHFDFVYVHLWALPFGPPWFEEYLSRRGVSVIYDIDDLIYLPRASAANQFVRAFRRPDRIVRIMRAAAHIIVCTEHLRRFAAAHNANVTMISSTIDTDEYQPRRHSAARDALTIGWSGSHSTAPFLNVIAPALQEVSRRFHIRLLVVGAAPFAMEGVAVETRPWSLERETADLSEMDVGVYPLPDEEWVLGKSGLKALQYMGVGVPVVASRIGAACEFIRDGDNGFLAGPHEEWVDRITRLVLDPQLRARMGMAGRATVEAGFSVRRTAPAYLRVITSVLGRSSYLPDRPDSQSPVRQSEAQVQASAARSAPPPSI
jgi:glycosyltransferase involved in cell wall biosynthesis